MGRDIVRMELLILRYKSLNYERIRLEKEKSYVLQKVDSSIKWLMERPTTPKGIIHFNTLVEAQRKKRLSRESYYDSRIKAVEDKISHNTKKILTGVDTLMLLIHRDD